MAGAGRNRSWLPAVALLLLAGGGVSAPGQAQETFTPRTRVVAAEATGSITGKLTDVHSTPLDGATVVVRNEATGAEARATTARNGSYRLTGLTAGEYTLEAQSPRLGRGRMAGIVVVGGGDARLQTALEFAPPEMERMAERPAAALAANPAHEDVLPARQKVETEVAEEPLRQLALMASRLPQREAPAAALALLATSVDREPIAQLAVSGQRISWGEAPRPASPQVSGTVAAEPLTALPLPERNAAPARIDLARNEAAIAAVGEPAAVSALPARGLMPAGTPPVLHAAGGPVLSATAAAVGNAGVMLAGLRPLLGRAEAFEAALQADPAAPAVTTTITAAQLGALPSSGRRWEEFQLDTPTAAAGAGGGAQVSLRGAGGQAPETTVDGAGARLAFGGEGSGGGSSTSGVQGGMGQAWSSGRGLRVSEAAIREVQTFAGNAGGGAAGGRISVATERGGNGLHGQGFLYDRQNAWGAQNPFTQWVKETAPGTLNSSPVFTPQPYTPPDQELKWGVGMGSRWRREKLFWFAALDGYLRNDPGVATVKHPDNFFAQPSNDQMQVLSARLALPSTNPVAEGLAAYSGMLEKLGALLGPAPRTAQQWVGFGRIDWQWAERHRFTLEGTGARWQAPGGGLTRVSEPYGANSFGSSQASQEWLLGRWEAFVTPNLLATAQGSAGRNILSAHAGTPSAFEQTLLGASSWGQLPQMVVDSRYGFTIGNPSRFGAGSYPDEHIYSAQESVDWVKGGLLFKAGFAWNHNLDSTSLLRNQTGTYYYANVENFISDALVYGAYGISGALNPYDQHNCDQTGRAWRDGTGQLHGLGALPCYSYFSQTMGPSDWYLSTNDWAGYGTAQWQPKKLLVLSAGLRWEREDMPPPIASLSNPELPLTQRLPRLGSNWGPRFSMALGSAEGHRPVLRLGYGMYFGRTQNSTLETALTRTGSLSGDVNLFMRPTDDLHSGGAPPFPYVPAGEPGTVVKPGAVEFAPEFHNPQVHQALASVEESLPGHVVVSASALVSLGRRLPVSIDTNFDPAVNPGTIIYGVVDGLGAGPIKQARITVPFYASWPSAHSATGLAGRLNPDYQQIAEVFSRANSTYEAAVFKISRYGRKGLSLHAHYTYSHAMDWNPNESAQVMGSDVLDPADFRAEYGVSNLDTRHSAALMAIYDTPWKLRGTAGKLGNNWMLSGIASFRSGLPYTMRTSGSLAEEFDTVNGAAIVALGPGMNGSGGDSRVYGVGRNTYRYPAAWKADLRLGKKWDLGAMRQMQLLVESFNLFNHRNVTELETTGYYIQSGSLSGGLPTLNFLTGLKTGQTAFGQPLNVNATNFYRERQIQVGVKMRF